VLEASVTRDLMVYSGPVAVMSFNPHSMIAMAAFIAALDETTAQAERHAERVVNTFAYDR
jgi:hypothetical protein